MVYVCEVCFGCGIKIRLGDGIYVVVYYFLLFGEKFKFNDFILLKDV